MGPDRETVAGLAAGILARVRLHSSESEERGDEIDECGEALISLLIAGCDPPKRLEIAEKVFDQMAPLVHFLVIDNGLGPVGLGRNDGRRSAFVQLGAEPVAVECLVALSELRTPPR